MGQLSETLSRLAVALEAQGAARAPRRFSLTLRSGEGGQGVRRIPYTSWGKSLFLATPEVLTHNGLNMVIQKAGLLKLLAVSQSVSQSVTTTLLAGSSRPTR